MHESISVISETLELGPLNRMLPVTFLFFFVGVRRRSAPFLMLLIALLFIPMIIRSLEIARDLRLYALMISSYLLAYVKICINKHRFIFTNKSFSPQGIHRLRSEWFCLPLTAGKISPFYD